MSRLARISIVLAAITCLVPTLAMADVAKVTSHRYLQSPDFERELTIALGDKPVRFLLNPSVVTSRLQVTNVSGETQPFTNTAFAGIIAGEKNSWARLSITEHRLSGVYSRNGRQYEITTSGYGQISVNPLSEQHIHHHHHHGKRTALGLVRKPVSRVADIAIVVDSKYDNFYGGNGVEKALSIINAVDGIYREEFALALRVTKLVTVNDANNDPFNYGSIPIEQMLRNFRSYRLGAADLSDVSLVHLFTGNRNSDEPVGLAWINTACRSDGYDVGLSTPYRHDVLLAAHEIAHNLGAQHDTDTACSAEDSNVMWPYISTNTSQSFSSCTLEAVEQALQNSCHAETIDLQVSLNQTDNNTVAVTVRNNDNFRANPSATLTVNLPENSLAAALDGSCENPAGELTCNIGALQAGAEETVSFTLISSPNGDRSAAFIVENADFTDPKPQNNHASVLINNAEIVALIDPSSFTGQDEAAGAVSINFDGIGGISPADLSLSMLVLAIYRRKRKAVFFKG